MLERSVAESQVLRVTNFDDFVSASFAGKVNAICLMRTLVGDFVEIVNKVEIDDGLAELDEKKLRQLHLTEQGQLARDVLINDLKLLTARGASPILNIIEEYERDDTYPFFARDVYSFHVDRSPVPTDTFLCTYYGEPSEILANSEAEKKALIPEITQQLQKLYGGKEDGFESFLSEHFFDLHYNAKPGARPLGLGLGHLWRLAVDHPESKVPPCIHRAPKEKAGQRRLLLIC
jgi:hypothetical protein